MSIAEDLNDAFAPHRDYIDARPAFIPWDGSNLIQGRQLAPESQQLLDAIYATGIVYTNFTAILSKYRVDPAHVAARIVDAPEDLLGALVALIARSERWEAGAFERALADGTIQAAAARAAELAAVE